MSLELTVVDAFTSAPFSGNPAAVSVLEHFPDDERMQAVAGEMNLSETAFVVPADGGSYALRWFTPTDEVKLCGHATLAAAHVLGGTARFSTKSGILTCATNASGWIEMDFPSNPATEALAPEALGLPGVVWFGTGESNVLVELEHARLVRDLVPDLGRLGALSCQAVIVTAAGDRAGIDCVSRVFAPNVGIPEDPVTGSAHCTLAPYWAARLGRTSLVGEQVSRRRGVVAMALHGERVLLSGQAVTTAHVTLLV